MPLLAEDELSAFKRGRNNHVSAIPKSATAVEYRRLCHTAKSSHAGLVPAMGLVNPQHRTAVKHLWFVGQQSESTGGVGAVMMGAKRAFVQMKKENKL